MEIRVYFASLALAGLMLVHGPTAAHAGSALAMGASGVTLDAGATSLLDATTISMAHVYAQSTGSGIYGGITDPLDGGPVGDPATLDLNNLGSFTWTLDGFTFASNSNSNQDRINLLTANSLVVYLRGDVNGEDSSLNLTASYTGGQTSISWTMNTPAISNPAIPEPSSMILGLTGVGALGMVHLVRRRNRPDA